MKLSSMTALLLLLSSFAFGQNEVKPLDQVELKDGMILRGEIVSYQQGGILTLRKMDGVTIEVQDADIARIQQGLVPTAEKAKTEAPKPQIARPKSKGLYTSTMLSFAAGNGELGNDGSDLALGAGFGLTVGYQFNKMLGAGIGFGIDNYSRRGETVYPLFGEVRALLPSKKGNGNPYVLGAGGYAHAFKRESLDIELAEGGLMYHMALGYRALTNEGLDVNLDLGYRFQQAHWERKLINGDVEIRDVDYRRVVVRVGLTLW